jgi:hypothetical protein
MRCVAWKSSVPHMRGFKDGSRGVHHGDWSCYHGISVGVHQSLLQDFQVFRFGNRSSLTAAIDTQSITPKSLYVEQLCI